ncbi:MAG TPA: metalloregulator ArsR/SmtB family transcription factor [Methylomirabilota bacterium]|nr:metalloregulator ArsR/SmtB family transcription factor [Methylomirabilota bacterium]
MAYKSALAALSDPTRRAVFERIVKAPRSVGEIAQGLPISRPAVSQHLKVLREAGLVQEERQGTHRIYSADAKALGELRAYVDQMWQAALGKFAEAVGERKGRKR